MANTVALTVYTLTFNSYSARTPLILDDGSGAPPHNFRQVLEHYLTLRSNLPYTDDLSKELLRVKECPGPGPAYSGRFESGEYGYEASLYDVDHAHLAYQRRINEAELLPLYFMFVVPQGAHFGLVLLQKFGQKSIKSLLDIDFNTFLTNYYPQQYYAAFDQLTPAVLVNRYLQAGHINKISFIKYRIPSDIADQFDQQFDTEEGNYEVVIKARKKGELPLVTRMREVLNKQRDPKDFIAIPGIQYDKVKVTLDVGGKIRTVDLENPANLRAAFVLTNEIERGPDGHPTFASIDREARELARGILRDLRVDGSYV